MSDGDRQPSSGKAPATIVRNFIEDPMIRILGFLLILAAGVLLYISPESSVPLTWRGGPVPDSWQRANIADNVSIALPPEMQPVGERHFECESLALDVHTGADAFPIVRDRDTMADFRALSSQLEGREVRIASWKRAATSDYQLGVAFEDVALTLIFTTDEEDDLYHAKTAVQSIRFGD